MRGEQLPCLLFKNLPRLQPYAGSMVPVMSNCNSVTMGYIVSWRECNGNLWFKLLIYSSPPRDSVIFTSNISYFSVRAWKCQKCTGFAYVAVLNLLILVKFSPCAGNFKSNLVGVNYFFQNLGSNGSYLLLIGTHVIFSESGKNNIYNHLTLPSPFRHHYLQSCWTLRRIK